MPRNLSHENCVNLDSLSLSRSDSRGLVHFFQRTRLLGVKTADKERGAPGGCSAASPERKAGRPRPLGRPGMLKRLLPNPTSARGATAAENPANSERFSISFMQTNHRCQRRNTVQINDPLLSLVCHNFCISSKKYLKNVLFSSRWT